MTTADARPGAAGTASDRFRLIPVPLRPLPPDPAPRHGERTGR